MNYLLLIGIDKYPKFLHPGNLLTTCVKDITDFKYVLLEKYFFEEKNVIELTDGRATNLNIQKSLESYIKKLSVNDSLIIYFSGHGGIRSETDKGYWIPGDADENNFSTWISNETILDILKKVIAKHIFVIADCCFASSLLITNPRKVINKVSLDNYKSRWILTSGREITYCGSSGENSYFGESLISLLGNSDENLRVGTIIEHVKENFKANILQQPQGYPLLDRNHDRGEFTFKLKESKKLFDREIKGYNLFKKVIDIYSKSNTIDEIDNFEDKTNKIGYTLLRENDKVRKEITYYLYLFNEINFTRTHATILEKHKNVLGTNTIVFLPKEERQVFLERRLSNAEKIFLPKNIFYIDVFINNLSAKSMSNDDDSKYLNITNFIVPEYTTTKKRLDVNQWLNLIDSPILVIKGTAGIGKTTFAKYISDLYQTLNKENNKGNVLFIDSNEIQEELLYQQKLGKKIDLYSFYKAATSNESSLDQELFAINLDAGNLLLIIDGLDEVISRNLSFDIDYFFNSINSSNVGLGNSKIVITTRSYFWDKSNIVDDIIYDIELMPFDLSRARNFFEKSFSGNENKLKKALQISDDFKLPSNEIGVYFYHPFVLDIIKEIIASDNEILFNDTVFTSSILNKNIKIDYIIGRICEREIKRVQQIEVDKQITFFIHLAVKENGKFSDDSMKDFLKESLEIKAISKNTVDTFNSHPFLHFDHISSHLTFKYDFFENYFTSLYISKIIDLNTETTLDYTTIKLLSQKLYHGSDTIKNIIKHINNWNDDNLLKINDIINKIVTFETDEPNLTKKAISGIFNLALAINFHFKTNSRTTNTQLIKDLFGDNIGQIEHLVILNLLSLEENIRFDFSSLTFNKCIFENYNQFLDCNLTSNTYFYNCTLRNIGSSYKEIHIPRENFIDCDQDNSLFNAYQGKEDRQGIKTSKAKTFLDDFLKIFYKNGRFKKISDFLLDESMNYPRINKYGIKRSELTDLLISSGIIIRSEDKRYNDVKIFINPIYIEVVTKFCFEGKVNDKLVSAIEEIRKKI
ncbi:caspase family protein [Pedobacter psychrotolerans]|uniref:caspase family protein n=1 Tax=Pedobacter psychrotolerans TaxID=1843235 RepID=UPI003F9969D0